MKKLAVVAFFSFSFLWTRSQKIQTIVPKQVVAGNAFQIQYIITDGLELANINPPQFENLQLVSGPNYYKGNSLVNGKAQAIENITYTLVSLQEGQIKIKPISVRFKNGDEERSDEVMVNVIPEPQARFNAFSTYTDVNLYAPSSKTDFDKLIEDNLFIKAEVDKRTCYLGEAITATFKLYSRLQSISEIVNAPSLYGFSVMDIPAVNETHQAVETINGKVFNTSLLRKLILYPSQSGKLRIDAMQLQNEIEFLDSSTGRKIKIDKPLASTPIDVIVKSFPTKEPDGFTGAVGKFTMRADMPASKIEANAQGKIIVTIEGKGNFIQFGAPAIEWPKGLDVFEPVVKDEFNGNNPTAEGTRKYVFNFIAGRIGDFTIPPVSFNFFDPSVNKFNQVSTGSLKFEVVAPSKTNVDKIQKLQQSPGKYFVYAAIIAILVLLVLFFAWKKKKKSELALPVADKPGFVKILNSLHGQALPDKQFYLEVQKLLLQARKEYVLTEMQKQQLQSIYNNCQLLAYSDINTADKKDELSKTTGEFLKQLEA